MNVPNLNRMITGIDNIGCTYDERKAFANLTDPICSAIKNQSLAPHSMPIDADERMAKAESMFIAIQAQNRLKNRARYL